MLQAFFESSIYAQVDTNKIKFNATDDLNYKEIPQAIKYEDDILIDPDFAPEFPGSSIAFHDYIKNNIKMPVPTNCREGTVYIEAIVDTNGNLTDLILRKGICQQYDDEALRLIKNMPRWKPGIINNKVTKVKILIPISFESKFYNN